MSELVTVQTKAVEQFSDKEIVAKVARAKALLSKTRADSTVETYQSAWNQWERFALACKVSPLPASPEAVVMYVSELEERGISMTHIQKVIAAIRYFHLRGGYDHPTSAPIVQEALAAARIALGERQGTTRARALTVDEIKKMSAACKDGTKEGIRNRALLLIGVALGLRSDELCNLNVESCHRVTGGYEIRLKKTKTDQSAKGATLALAYGPERLLDPVGALEALIGERTTGPLFKGLRGRQTDRLTPDSVSRILRRLEKQADLTVKTVEGIRDHVSSHSLRSSFVTLAFSAEVELQEIMRTSRHKRTETAMLYNRSAAWKKPASAAIWNG